MMNILSITAGAAGMYCGSCSRDNAQAIELLKRGHKVTLLPLYTPTNPDERNVSEPRVLFGGISIYLQQYAPLFRRMPRFLDRLWDAPWVINAFATRAISTDPKLLGDLTISMLDGDRGVLRREFDKLLEWIAEEPVPDVINLPNTLLIGLAGPLKRALKRPICCTLQGEDLFLDGLVEPYRARAIELIRKQVPDVDLFLSVSDYYVPIMSAMLAIPPERIAVVPLGINLDGGPTVQHLNLRASRPAASALMPQRFVSATSRECLRKRASTYSPMLTVCFARRRRRCRCGSTRPATWPPRRRRISIGSGRRSTPRVWGRIHVSRRGRSRRQGLISSES